MTEHTDNALNLGNFVVDDNDQERQSWKCFGKTCNRSHWWVHAGLEILILSMIALILALLNLNLI